MKVSYYQWLSWQPNPRPTLYFPIVSLSKQLTFHAATTGFPVKWRCKMNAEIPYWSCNTTQIWFPTWHDQSEALPCCRKWSSISMEFLPLFLRCHFVGTPVVASRKSVVFSGYPIVFFMLGLFVFHLRPHAILFPLLSHFSQWFSPERKERKILLRASCGLKYKLKISITKGLLKLEVLGKVPRVSFTDAGMSLVSQASTCRWSDFSMTLKWKCTNKTETTNKEK